MCKLPRTMRALTPFFLTAVVCAIPLVGLGQKLSIGIVAGGSLTDSFPTVTTSFGPPQPAFSPAGTRTFASGKDYVLGPAAELTFSPYWSLEVDGLYRKLHFVWAAVEQDGSLNSVSPSPVVTWEFPVLAKYRFHWLEAWGSSPN